MPYYIRKERIAIVHIDESGWVSLWIEADAPMKISIASRFDESGALQPEGEDAKLELETVRQQLRELTPGILIISDNLKLERYDYGAYMPQA